MGASLTRMLTHLPTLPRCAVGSSSTTKKKASPAIQPVSPSIHNAESEMLNYLTPSTFTYEKRQILLPTSSSEQQLYINVLSCGSTTSPSLLLLPGWGAGAAFYSLNLESLSANFRVHAIDWPGFGASSRPSFNYNWDASKAETFFTEHLYKFIETFPKYEPTFSTNMLHIAAHSLGAYLASTFAIRYPHKVQSLILASPVGIPEAPIEKIPQRLPWIKRLLFRIVFKFWDAGYTPQHFIRTVPIYFGKCLCSLMITSRLVITNAIDSKALKSEMEKSIVNYFYEISAGPCSAELSLCTILESGAYAKLPLCHRFPDVTSIQNIVFLFGDRDWMSVQPAKDLCHRLLRNNSNVNATVAIVPDAGHHVYFDNPNFFNRIIVDTCLGHQRHHEQPSSSRFS